MRPRKSSPIKTKRLAARPASPLDGGDAFLPDSRLGRAHLDDDEVDAFAEEFLAAATSAEMVAEDARDEMTLEELGGPFLEITAEDLKPVAEAEAVEPELQEEAR